MLYTRLAAVSLNHDGTDGTGIQSVSPVPSASAAGSSVSSVSNSRRKLTNWFANRCKHLTWETGYCHQSPREGLQHDRQLFFDRHTNRLSKAVFLLWHYKNLIITIITIIARKEDTVFSSSNSVVGSEKTINCQARVCMGSLDGLITTD